MFRAEFIATGVILEVSDRTWHGCYLLENADGTGSTLLDNAGAYYPEHILLNPLYKVLFQRRTKTLFKNWILD